jgi:hypothetical protein
MFQDSDGGSTAPQSSYDWHDVRFIGAVLPPSES